MSLDKEVYRQLIVEEAKIQGIKLQNSQLEEKLEEIGNSKDFTTHYSQIKDTNDLESGKNIHKLREMRYKE